MAAGMQESMRALGRDVKHVKKHMIEQEKRVAERSQYSITTILKDHIIIQMCQTHARNQDGNQIAIGISSFPKGDG